MPLPFILPRPSTNNNSNLQTSPSSNNNLFSKYNNNNSSPSFHQSNEITPKGNSSHNLISSIATTSSSSSRIVNNNISTTLLIQQDKKKRKRQKKTKNHESNNNSSSITRDYKLRRKSSSLFLPLDSISNQHLSTSDDDDDDDVNGVDIMGDFKLKEVIDNLELKNKIISLHHELSSGSGVPVIYSIQIKNLTSLLYDANVFEDKNPWKLLFSLWWLLHYYIGIGNVKHHSKLLWKDIKFVSNKSNNKKDDLKNNSSGDYIEYRGPNDYLSNENAFMYKRIFRDTALNDKSLGPDFVQLFQSFMERRPQQLRSKYASFYLSLNGQDSLEEGITWFTRHPLNKRIIGSLFDKIIGPKPIIEQVYDSPILLNSPLDKEIHIVNNNSNFQSPQPPPPTTLYNLSTFTLNSSPNNNSSPLILSPGQTLHALPFVPVKPLYVYASPPSATTPICLSRPQPQQLQQLQQQQQQQQPQVISIPSQQLLNYLQQSGLIGSFGIGQSTFSSNNIIPDPQIDVVCSADNEAAYPIKNSNLDIINFPQPIDERLAEELSNDVNKLNALQLILTGSASANPYVNYQGETPHQSKLQTIYQLIKRLNENQSKDFWLFYQNLWDSGILGEHHPENAQFTMWLMFTIAFPLNTTSAHVQLKWNEITLGRALDKTEFLHYQNPLNKMDYFLSASNVTDEPGLLYEASRCPVYLYKSLARRRPVCGCTPDSPYYETPLPIQSNVNMSSELVWFENVSLKPESVDNIFKVCPSITHWFSLLDFKNDNHPSFGSVSSPISISSDSDSDDGIILVSITKPTITPTTTTNRVEDKTPVVETVIEKPTVTVKNENALQQPTTTTTTDRLCSGEQSKMTEESKNERKAADSRVFSM